MEAISIEFFSRLEILTPLIFAIKAGLTLFCTRPNNAEFIIPSSSKVSESGATSTIGGDSNLAAQDKYGQASDRGYRHA